MLPYVVVCCRFQNAKKTNIFVFRMVNSRILNSPQNPLIDKKLPSCDNNLAIMGKAVKENSILHSWKEISAYLDRDYRTCQRWEIELGLPVHRIDESSSRSKVFAYKSEIDAWLKEKANNHIHEKRASIWTNKRAFAGLALGFLLIAVFFAWLYFFQSPVVS